MKKVYQPQIERIHKERLMDKNRAAIPGVVFDRADDTERNRTLRSGQGNRVASVVIVHLGEVIGNDGRARLLGHGLKEFKKRNWRATFRIGLVVSLGIQCDKQ